MKIAPASSAPRRRTAAKTPSALQRRTYAATQMADFSRMGFVSTGRRLFQRPAGHGRELAYHVVGDLAGDWKAAVALELLDGRLGRRIIDTGRLDLPIAKIGQRALDRQHSLGRDDQFRNRIAASGRGSVGALYVCCNDRPQ